MDANPEMPNCFALIACAGVGARAGTAQPKQYQPVAGKPMVQHVLNAFGAVTRIRRVLVVVAPDDAGLQDLPAAVEVARCGGASRAESVLNGLSVLAEQGANADNWVLVHDAARCLITPEQINRLIDACWRDPIGGLLAVELADTLKLAGGDGRVVSTIRRQDKWLGQTPQMFRLGVLQAALQAQQHRGFEGITDESSAMEAAGHRPLLVPGGVSNFKVTYPEDLILADVWLRSARTGLA